MTDLQVNGGGWIEAVEAGDRGGPALAAVGRWVIATARELSADLEEEPGT